MTHIQNRQNFFWKFFLKHPFEFWQIFFWKIFCGSRMIQNGGLIWKSAILFLEKNFRESHET